MAKNTSIVLGEHFDNFISSKIKDGRYGSASEVEALRRAIIEGEESGNAGELDMEEIRRRAKKKAGLTPSDA